MKAVFACIGEQTNEYADVVTLLGGSAVGKTKAVYDVAAISPAILLDCSNPREETDVAKMFRNIHNLVPYGNKKDKTV